MAARKPRKTPWQVAAIEVMIAVACGFAAYGLTSLSPAGHDAALVLGGAAAALALRLATRHGKPRKRGTRKSAAAGRRR